MNSICVFFVAFSILNLSVNVYANQPIVRFKNRTVGILADADAGVFTATENVTILGDLEVKATNKTANIIEEVDSLIRLRNDVELRIKYFSQHEGMGVVCNPEGTEYRSRNFETGEFGACICKEGYMGNTCTPVINKVTTACEHAWLNLECSANAFVEINSAVYGRSDKMTCPHTAMSNTDCAASSSMDIVVGKCEGQESCSVFAANSIFGDPCGGTYKYLTVNYVCIPNNN